MPGGNEKPPPGAIRWVLSEFAENSWEEHINPRSPLLLFQDCELLPNSQVLQQKDAARAKESSSPKRQKP